MHFRVQKMGKLQEIYRGKFTVKKVHHIHLYPGAGAPVGDFRITSQLQIANPVGIFTGSALNSSVWP